MHSVEYMLLPYDCQVDALDSAPEELEDPKSLEAGRLLMHYRLVEEIGAGGMGVVWKAIDTTLERDVAIKVLPESFAAEGERLRRFEREAKLLATLNHPNIATVHGLHQADGVPFLAMELVPGEDFAQRIARGALPVDEALDIASQITEALEAAHENGVIHRDLKPANIRLTPEGRIKVLDFGLAKAFAEEQASSASPSMSPTVTSAGTQAGVILGTAAYMSPEQAKGQAVDKRADIWAFGCILLEMLTGRATFRGDSVAEILAAVLKEQPELENLPEGVPAKAERLLRRCLIKDPRQRLRDIGDARIAIAEMRAGVDETNGRDAIATAGGSRARWAPWAVAAVLAVALAATWIFAPSKGPGSDDTSRLTRLSAVLAGDAAMFLANMDQALMPAFALSPDGERLVYVSLTEGAGQTRAGVPVRTLRMRERDGYEAEIVRGSEHIELPFFSPDGRWIGFFDGTSVSKIPTAGGARVLVSDGIGNGTGASWSPDGTIVFAHSYVGPLWRVPDSGGVPTAFTTLADGESSHRYPQVLPGGRFVVFTVKHVGIRSFDDARIGIADMRTGEHRILLEGGCYARYAASGHLVYARDGGLLAAPFDLERGELAGAAVPVMEGVTTNPVSGAALFDIAMDGTLAFVAGDYRAGPASLMHYDRDTGKPTVLAPDHYATLPRLSPDGRHLVLHGAAAYDEVLTLDLERGTVARMTDSTSNCIMPIWSPGGDRILYTTDRSGQDEIVRIPAGGGSIEKLVPPSGPPQTAYSWSPDGALLAINYGVRTSRDILVFDTTTGAEPAPFVATRFDEGDPVWSPDGRWIVYTSSESGTPEVYASPYPGPGGKIQLSTGGGYFPRLREDGAELYYQTSTQLFVVPLTWTPSPRPGRPEALLDIAAANPLGFDVSADGRHFYVVELDENRWKSGRVDIVLDWFDELKELVSE